MAMEDDYAYLRQAHIVDFEQIDALSRTTDSTIVQLEDGPFKCDIVKLKAGGVLVSQTTSNRRLRVLGTAKYFNITSVNCLRNHATWNGSSVGKNQLVAVKANETFDLVVPPRTTTMCVALADDVHTRMLASGSKLTQKRVREITHSISCQPAALRKFERWLTGILEHLIEKGSIAEDAEALERDVVDRLVQCISAPIESNWGKDPTELRRNALEKIHEHLAEGGRVSGSIDQLCAIGEVSRRTLEYAFREIYGCSPRKFLKAHNLSSARLDLLKANVRGLTVSSVAQAHGFSHLSQFASDYQRRFGELPRETLARSDNRAELEDVCRT